MAEGNVAPTISPSFEFSLVVLNGKDQGVTYRLTGQRVTLGRGEENDIQFQSDMKCSRQHAVIEFEENGIFIENISESNVMIVDKIEVQKSRIKNLSHIVLGETELKLRIKTPQDLGLVAVPNQIATSSIPKGPKTLGPGSGRSNPTFQGSFHQQTSSSQSQSHKSSSMIRYLVGGLAILFLYLILSETSKKKDITEIRTDEAVDAEIEKTQKLRDSVIEQRQKQGKNSQQYTEAQAVYLQGFRDYKQGIYGRSLELFQACLSLFPEHSLCLRYLKLAQRKYNELTQYHMILGRKYREYAQFTACKASFRNVMVMVVDANSPIYKEAKANYEACDTMVEERY